MVNLDLVLFITPATLAESGTVLRVGADIIGIVVFTCILNSGNILDL